MIPPNTNMTVYDAANTERISLQAWPAMVRELYSTWELTCRLVTRNIAGQFRQSFLGYVWIALPPMATAIVFTLLRKADIINVPMPQDAMPYALFTLLGTTLWQFFTQVTLMATTSITSAGALVSKIYFPREVLILSAAGNALLNLVIRLAVLVLAFVVLGYLPHWQAIFVPIVIIPVFFLGLGMGLLFAPLNTVMHDTSRMLDFAFQFGMFLAPTVYPTPAWSMADSTWQKALYWLHTLNPVSHFITAADDLVQFGTMRMDFGLGCATVLSFLLFFIGWRFFHTCEPLMAERL